MSAPELFCPRCAAAMQRVAGELTCVVGDMGLASALEAELVRRFAGSVRRDAPVPSRGSQWFCPACRVALGDGMNCPECGGTLYDLRFPLVELHPHRNPT